MPQMNQVAESFLDGFGCLAAILEPVVRPGSRDNLIQEDLELQEDLEPSAGALAQHRPGRRETGELVWSATIFGIGALASAAFSLLPATGWVEWSLRGSEILAIGGGTLFLRATLRIVLPIVLSRSKTARPTGAKASHGV